MIVWRETKLTCPTCLLSTTALLDDWPQMGDNLDPWKRENSPGLLLTSRQSQPNILVSFMKVYME